MVTVYIDPHLKDIMGSVMVCAIYTANDLSRAFLKRQFLGAFLMTNATPAAKRGLCCFRIAAFTFKQEKQDQASRLG